MATQALRHFASGLQRPLFRAATNLRRLPPDFLSALQAGWEIVGEASKLTGDRKSRRGRIVLGKDRRLIQVNYTVTQKMGFRFDKPRLI